MKSADPKFTRGKWYTKMSPMNNLKVFYPRGFLTSGIIEIDETRLEGESWLAMRERTKNIRVKANTESSANMYLIASSPSLYSEIEEDINRLENITSLDEWLLEYDKIAVHLERKRELLAKSRGEANND